MIKAVSAFITIATVACAVSLGVAIYYLSSDATETGYDAQLDKYCDNRDMDIVSPWIEDCMDVGEYTNAECQVMARELFCGRVVL